MEDQVFLERLGKKISTLREKEGISQNELARRLNTGNNQIRRIEKAIAAPNILTLKKIGDELGILLSELVNV